MLFRSPMQRPGVWNLTGPAETTSLEALLAACVPPGTIGPEMAWADDAFLLAQGVAPWSELPLWIPSEQGCIGAPNTRALRAGLRLRPLSETASDTRAWALAHRANAPDWRARRPGARGDVTLTRECKAALLAAWAAWAVPAAPSVRI